MTQLRHFVLFLTNLRLRDFQALNDLLQAPPLEPKDAVLWIILPEFAEA